jgi:putative intracellular protease/amidase
MGKRVLMVVTSNGQIGSTGGATGSWLEELAACYYSFKDRGHAVEIASPLGGKAPIDPASREEPWITDQGRRFLSDREGLRQVEQTRRIDSIDVSRIDAVLLVGGVGAAWDFPNSEDLRALVESIDRRGSVVAGICHGVLGLTAARRADGSALVAGRNVTGVSNANEKLFGFDTVLPVLPEQRLTDLGGQYSCATEHLRAHVVRDGNLVTGEGPASAGPLVDAIIDAMG